LCCLLPFGVGSHQKVVGVTSHAAMVKKYVSLDEKAHVNLPLIHVGGKGKGVR
jgi:hypothetical protein